MGNSRSGNDVEDHPANPEQKNNQYGCAESLSCVLKAPEGISRVSSRGGWTRQHVGDLQVVTVADPNDRVGAADDCDPSADRPDRTLLGTWATISLVMDTSATHFVLCC